MAYINNVVSRQTILFKRTRIINVKLAKLNYFLYAIRSLINPHLKEYLLIEILSLKKSPRRYFATLPFLFLPEVNRTGKNVLRVEPRMPSTRSNVY